MRGPPARVPHGLAGSAVRPEGGHPYEFYQTLGFVILGVIPDANGLGKPDILMAKRLVTE